MSFILPAHMDSKCSWSCLMCTCFLFSFFIPFPLSFFIFHYFLISSPTQRQNSLASSFDLISHDLLFQEHDITQCIHSRLYDCVYENLLGKKIYYLSDPERSIWRYLIASEPDEMMTGLAAVPRRRQRSPSSPPIVVDISP